MGYAYGCFVEVKNNVPNSETRHSTFVKAECPDQSCLVLELELNSKPLCKFWSFLIKKKEKKNQGCLPWSCRIPYEGKEFKMTIILFHFYFYYMDVLIQYFICTVMVNNRLHICSLNCSSYISFSL